MGRKKYPSDVSHKEWSFVAPYPSSMTPEAPQRKHNMREVFNAVRWLVRSGAAWRYLRGDFLPTVRATRPTVRAVHRAKRSASRPSGGLKQRCLKRWLMICGRLCG